MLNFKHAVRSLLHKIANNCRNARFAASSKARLVLDRVNCYLDDYTYSQWLQRQINSRGRHWQRLPIPVSFSILTCVYERSPAELFRATASSVLRQTYTDFEWVVVAQGPIPPALSEAISEITKHSRIRYIKLEQNLGIVGGMRKSLDAATGEYVFPLDGDDLLTPDALECLAHAIIERGRPEFVYSDEDHWIDGSPRAPYFRSDWDPILNLSGSYIWHICAFTRRKAIELGVFTDSESNWCQDWDTVSRFSQSGIEPLHIPEILYHWRRHEHSTTNQPNPAKGSLDSQRHVLQMWISRQAHSERYAIEPFPFFRGAPEWWIKRRRQDPEPFQIVLMAGSSAHAIESITRVVAESEYPFLHIHILGISSIPLATEEFILTQLHKVRERFPELHGYAPQLQCWPESGLKGFVGMRKQLQPVLTLVYSSKVKPKGDEWAWEALCLKEFHPSIALFSGRILNQQSIVLAGGEQFAAETLVTCPDYGKAADDPGRFALSLKERTVGAVDSDFFIADGSFLDTFLSSLPQTATMDHLGAWLGAEAITSGQRVAYSPLISAVADSSYSKSKTIDREQIDAIKEKFPFLRALKPSAFPRHSFADLVTSSGSPMDAGT